jgi:hypothetical protein
LLLFFNIFVFYAMIFKNIDWQISGIEMILLTQIYYSVIFFNGKQDYFLEQVVFCWKIIFFI